MKKMKKFFITNKQREQAERMVAKWEARAEAYWKGETEGYGVGVIGYCKNDEQALEAERIAGAIEKAIHALIQGFGSWAEVIIVRNAVQERNLLDNKV
jgi:hypothetical protein